MNLEFSRQIVEQTSYEDKYKYKPHIKSHESLSSGSSMRSSRHDEAKIAASGKMGKYQVTG
jgi:hypothetical protein